MAFIDYGLIVKKNNEIVENNFCDDVYAYHIVNDKDCEVYVYKNSIGIRTDKNINICDLNRKYNLLCNEVINENKKIIWINLSFWTVYPIIKYRYKFTIGDIDFDLKRIENGDRFYLRFGFNSNLYEVVYGYLIESNTQIDKWYDVKCLSNKCRNFIRNWVRKY